VDRSTFTELVRQNGDPDDVAALGRIFSWSDSHRMRDTWTKHAVLGDEWIPVMKDIEWEPAPFGIGSTPPRFYVSGGELRRHHPFRNDQRWGYVLERLFEIAGVAHTKKDDYPKIPLRALAEQQTWAQLASVLEDVMTEVRRSSDRGIR
jgi:hypothetical protein